MGGGERVDGMEGEGEGEGGKRERERAWYLDPGLGGALDHRGPQAAVRGDNIYIYMNIYIL